MAQAIVCQDKLEIYNFKVKNCIYNFGVDKSVLQV